MCWRDLVRATLFKQEFRRRGHASAALTELEPIARGLGLSGIGLHVFGHNAAARALYGKLVHAITGVNMLKPLGEAKARP
jgi:ribosomal protein S18 acetylase RimI-like enzyme